MCSLRCCGGVCVVAGSVSVVCCADLFVGVVLFVLVTCSRADCFVCNRDVLFIGAGVLHCYDDVFVAAPLRFG